MNKDTYVLQALLERLPSSPPPWQPLGMILALVTEGRFAVLEPFMAEAFRRGVPAGGVREILLQAHLFAGFPRAIRALKTFHHLQNATAPSRSPRAAPRPEPLSPRRRRARGAKVFEAVYGKRARTVLSALEALHTGYGRWVLEDAYGRVLGRPGFPARWRELCAVSALAVTDVPEQLYSHIRGALRLGARSAEVAAAIRCIAPLVTPKKIDHALEILTKMDVK